MNFNKLKTGLVSVLFILLVNYTSNGQADTRNEPKGKRPSAEQILEKLDKDKDGKLSKTETKGRLKNDFSKIDTNEDGFLSKEELSKAPKPRRPKK